jgi:lysophospholipid acyltransferase (LPLAT)-like uncharacterized protein
MPVPPRDLSEERWARWVGRLGALLIRLWGATLLVDWIGKENLAAIEREQGRVIYTFWHGQLLPLSFTHRGRGIVVLVSRHKDGEIISQILCRLGYGVARGSSTRGGLRALLEMARLGRGGYPLGVTPDGPRGPRHALQIGVLLIAQRSGLPIIPLAAEAVRRTELSSWDRFQIPHPWSRFAVVTGAPIWIPEGPDLDELEAVWAPRVRGALMDAVEGAKRWRAERTGRP